MISLGQQQPVPPGGRLPAHGLLEDQHPDRPGGRAHDRDEQGGGQAGDRVGDRRLASFPPRGKKAAASAEPSGRPGASRSPSRPQQVARNTRDRGIEGGPPQRGILPTPCCPRGGPPRHPWGRAPLAHRPSEAPVGKAPGFRQTLGRPLRLTPRSLVRTVWPDECRYDRVPFGSWAGPDGADRVPFGSYELRVTPGRRPLPRAAPSTGHDWVALIAGPRRHRP